MMTHMYDVENPWTDLGETQKCDMWSQPSPLYDWVSNGNTYNVMYINKWKETCTKSLPPEKTTYTCTLITIMNDNINMDSTTAGWMNALSYWLHVLARKVESVG